MKKKLIELLKELRKVIMINKKRKLIFEFKEDENGIIVTTRVKGKLTLNDVLCAKQVIDGKLKDVKNKRK